ncbi:heme peroxidase [Macroventuria anomochaeta]|uniref:Heme peroxidase n=1 Tax=Macroventuria anomochaeta TaxID=301207 RepID=A0ACB6S455_9PLEO|nr:heme peroxidase [Macroventuria anomochaeta]KAF2628738.1 heme peroxidase [Macroventuria anomochaeta]
MRLLASLPTASQTRDVGTGLLLKRLHDDLQHPPASSLGGPYKYRTADGSNNNIRLPNLGRAGSYYTRSVSPKHIPTNLPDPEILFDTLLARRAEPKAHPTKISSLLFALAGIIIHDLFRTSDEDKDVAVTSSYLDLSPLYGCNQEAQDSVRTMIDGKLKTDTFTEIRFINRPPHFAALLICFCRFHNSIATQLAAINENGRFTLPPQTTSLGRIAYKELLANRDNDLFQTARLITCGLYMQIVLNDYVRTILNLQRVDSDWKLDPRKDFDKPPGQTDMEKACGNQISVEFNLIYRWHSTISTKDERWLEQHTSKLLPDVKVESMTVQELYTYMHQFGAQQPSDPSQRTWNGLQPQPGGYFNDADLVRVLTEATEDTAASFGARQVPVVLRVIEVMGIQQARAWGVASLNEVRRHFGMNAHKSFFDINSDPDIATALENLYGDVENVELYPGVVVEETKVPMIPGSGLCAGFTTSRAILSNAMDLVRRDRFYTVDYTPHHLTAYGYKAASSDPSIAGGGVMHKLLMRALRKYSQYYRGDSVYALYPFTVPQETLEIQRSLGHEADYYYDAPTLISPSTLVSDWTLIENILKDSRTFIAPWELKLRTLGASHGSSMGTQPEIAKEESLIRTIILGPIDSLREFSCYVEKITSGLIRQNSRKAHNYLEIDIVNSVATSTWTESVARLLGIPLKAPGTPQGVLDSETLQEQLAALFRYIFSIPNSDSTQELTFKRNAFLANKQLRKAINEVCEAIKCSSFAHILLHRHDRKSSDNIMSKHGSELLQRLFESGKTVEEVVSLVVLLAVELVTPSIFAIVRILDLFLSKLYEPHWARVQQLSRNTAPWTSQALRVYVLEALRLVPPAAPCLRISNMYPGINDWRYAQAIKKGDTLLLDFAAAGRDGERFPYSSEMKLGRPLEVYQHLPFIDGLHSPLVKDIAVAGLAEQLRVFGKLKGLRRAPGAPGMLKKIRENGVVSYLNDAQDEWVPLPPSLKLRFDALP